MGINASAPPIEDHADRDESGALTSGAGARYVETMNYDVLIVGGGPGGLAAALTLGRANKRALLCDSGARRNAAAEEVHNFVTRDGTPPDEFRAIGRAQLASYPSVELRDTRVAAIAGARGAFRADLGSESVEVRRVLFCTGMVDEMLPIEGFEALWGHGIFQCPYCHGWEVRDRAWGYLARAEDTAHVLPFSLMLRGWSSNVTVFTNGFELAPEVRGKLELAAVKIETAKVRRLVGRDHELVAVELATGGSVPCGALFTHPPQHQVELVRTLGLALDEHGFVRVDPMTRETSVPGIYAAGDLTTRMQAAIAAAAGGMQAAAAINGELTAELVTGGGR